MLMTNVLSMTKAEWIARYGQQHYEAHVARCKAKLNAKYAAMSPEERTAQYLARKDQVETWHAAHPERVAEIGRDGALRAYHRLTPEEKRARYEVRYAKRKAKLAADREFAKAAAENQRERFQRFSEAHPGLVNERSLAWIKAHPEYRVSRDLARRTIGKAPAGFIALLRSQPCLDCGKPAAENKRGVSEIGHLIAVKNGGTNHPCNLYASCRTCNRRLSARTHPRFAMVNYPEAVAYAAAYEAA